VATVLDRSRLDDKVAVVTRASSGSESPSPVEQLTPKVEVSADTGDRRLPAGGLNGCESAPAAKIERRMKQLGLPAGEVVMHSALCKPPY
jgi:hypothetical protein